MWYWDTWDKNAYRRGEITDPMIEKAVPYRVNRGGSWRYDPIYGRVSSRFYSLVHERNFYGLRIARMCPSTPHNVVCVIRM